MESSGEQSALRYLDASRVHSPAGELNQVEVRDADDKTIGTIDGVLLDPAARRLRYLVVQSTGLFRRRKYLVPTEWPACVDASTRSLRVDMDDAVLAGCAGFERASVPAYSDDDLLAALFAQRVA